MTKLIGRFEPTPSRTPEECERHYTSVHIRMAQNMLAGMDGFGSYHVNRAVAQADVAGGFAQRPRAWRFVILRLVPGTELSFTPQQLETIFQDHVNCLYRLRQFEVHERVAFDARHPGSLGMAKFLIEVACGPDLGGAERTAAFVRLADRVTEAMRTSSGARLAIANTVLNESISAPVDVEGQRIVGVTEDTRQAGYLECYFDHARWGREALAPLVLDGRLSDDELSVAVLEVEEQLALDRTEPT